MDYSYLLEIELKKLELLNQYSKILENIESLAINSPSFEEKMVKFHEKLTNIFEDIKSYNKIFFSLTEKNKDYENFLYKKLKEEEIIKAKIEKQIENINSKFTKEKDKIQNSLLNLKIQGNNPFSEDTSRFFEEKI